MKMLMITRGEADFLLSILREAKNYVEDFSPCTDDVLEQCEQGIEILDKLQEVEFKIPDG